MKLVIFIASKAQATLYSLGCLKTTFSRKRQTELAYAVYRSNSTHACVCVCSCKVYALFDLSVINTNLLIAIFKIDISAAYKIIAEINSFINYTIFYFHKT